MAKALGGAGIHPLGIAVSMEVLATACVGIANLIGQTIATASVFAAKAYGIEVIMTGSQHKSGSDRLAEACEKLDCDIVVNVQGDEPLLKPAHIDAIVAPLLEDSSLRISVGVTPYTKKNSA